MLPSLGHFSEVPCVFFLSGSCNRPHCHFRHCAGDKTTEEGKIAAEHPKDDFVEWLGPKVRLSHVTQMIEKAVDRAILTNPDKNLNRASMITQALETLKRQSIAEKSSKHHGSTQSTSSGVPSYRPTPISVLNQRHIPVVAMPVKPMVVRKDKRPEEKPVIGAPPVTSSPYNCTSHDPKLRVESSRCSAADPKVALDEENSPESGPTLIQQISDFLGADMGTNNPSMTTVTLNERPPPPFSRGSESSGHSITDTVGSNKVVGNSSKAISNKHNDVIFATTNEELDASMQFNFDADEEGNVPLNPSNEYFEEQGKGVNIDIDDFVLHYRTPVDELPETAGIGDPLESALPEYMGSDHHQELPADTSDVSDRRHFSDSKKSDDSNRKSSHVHKNDSNSHKSNSDARRKSSDSNKKSSGSHKKGDESVLHSTKKGKDQKLEHSEKDKNGDGHHKKKPSRQSCHKKPSTDHANFPKKILPSSDQSDSSLKKSDREQYEKKSHHDVGHHDKKSRLDKEHQKSQEKDSHKHKEKHHQSHKHNNTELDKKGQSRSEKSKPSEDRTGKTSAHSSGSSHSKSKSSEHRSSSHSKDRDKNRKRKADEEYEKRSKVPKTEVEHPKDKKAKSDSDDKVSSERKNRMNNHVEGRPRKDSSLQRDSVKRKHSDSEDVDFIDSSSPNHSAIVISSSDSSDGCENEWASSPPETRHVSKSEDEIGNGFQTTIVDFKWSRAKEIIQRSTHSKMPRIAHVPNVMNILTAKTKLLSHETKPVVTKPGTPSPSSANPSNENHEGPQPKTVKRVAHGSQGAESRPVVKHVDNVKLPPGIRQHYCNKFYDELCKYLDPEKAKKLAVEEEVEVAKRCKLHKIYQNNCSLLLLKIRKMEGNIGKDEQAAVKWTSSSSPEFTYGLSLYKCFEKYLVPEEDLVKNGYPMPLPGQPNCAYIEKSARKYSVQQPDEPFKRRCVNCRKTYEIDQEGMPTTVNDCSYHWGRMRKVGGRSLQIEKYTCCDGADDSLPCQSNAYHVWSGKNEDCMPGFLKTREWPDYKDDSEAGVFALDCEMCYTTRGLELARLTVVDLNEEIIFDEVIALDNPVLDYCTRFSGIDEEKMRRATLSFRDVQNWVLENFFDKTILIGHSLENDLNALKIFHKRIVDTSITFPHKYGPPMKNSLKNLAMSFLALSIQDNETGHDSKEDAVTCLRLMMKRIKEDAKVRKPRVIIGYAGKKR